jgi:hypothetical protein
MANTLKKENGDIVIQESNGRPYYIRGTEKLNQDLADCLMITYDPSRDFGHELDNLLLNDTRLRFLNVITSTYIRNRVEEAISRLKTLQQSRLDQLANSEAIDSIRDIQVYQLKATDYVFIVDVVPVSGPDKDPLSFQIKLSHQLLDSASLNAPGLSFDDRR